MRISASGRECIGEESEVLVGTDILINMEGVDRVGYYNNIRIAVKYG